jgi:hypothetical protein
MSLFHTQVFSPFRGGFISLQSGCSRATRANNSGSSSSLGLIPDGQRRSCRAMFSTLLSAIFLAINSFVLGHSCEISEVAYSFPKFQTVLCKSNVAALVRIQICETGVWSETSRQRSLDAGTSLKNRTAPVPSTPIGRAWSTVREV